MIQYVHKCAGIVMVGSSVGSITGTVSLVLGFDVKDTVVVVFGSCVVLCGVVLFVVLHTRYVFIECTYRYVHRTGKKTPCELVFFYPMPKGGAFKMMLLTSLPLICYYLSVGTGRGGGFKKGVRLRNF